MITKIPINTGKLKSLRVDSQGKTLYTQLEVENATGLNKGLLTLIECGRYDPTPEQVEKLAQYYKVPTISIIREDTIPLIIGSAVQLAQLVGKQVK